MGYQGPANGIYASPNPFISGATAYSGGVGSPLGSLAKALNVQFTAANVLEPRRGNPPMASSNFGTTPSLANAMCFYGAALLIHYDLTKVSLRPAASSFTDFTTPFYAVGANRMRFENAARSIFWNAVTGLWCWDGVGVSGQPVLAGCPQGLLVSAVNASANGWLAPDSAVAYRFTICSKDAFGRVVEGPPSGRTTLRNLIRSTFGTSGVTRSGGATVHATSDQPHGLQVGDAVTLSPGETNFPAGSKTVTNIINAVQFDYAEAGANVSATVTQDWNITRSATVTCSLPTKGGTVSGVSTGNFLRIYRSEQVLTGANNVELGPPAVVPSDDLFKCYESAYLTAGQIAAGVLTFSDVAPDSSLAVPLYTNPNLGGDAGGILAARYRPPQALDHAYFANRMWFANTTDKHSAQLALIGCGSPAGLQVGDSLSLTSAIPIIYTYTAVATVFGVDTSTSTDFAVFLWGDPGQNIESTARSLCACINRDASSPYYAYYVSADGGTPGQILIVGTTFGDSIAFTLSSNRYTCWNPQLPPLATPPFLVSSNNNRHAAGLYYSPVGIPDAVPLLNFQGTGAALNSAPVASDGDGIIRIFPLHYRLLVFKTDGIYFVTDNEPFSCQKMSSFVLIAPDSVALLDERVFCLTDQGIVAISDAGVQPVSVPIDDVLTQLGGTVSLAALKSRAFGVGYRTARQYILWVLQEDDVGAFSTDNAQALVYSTLSNGFTRYDYGVRAAVVDANTDTLVVAPTNANSLLQESKTFTSADYADGSVVTLVSAIAGNHVTISDLAPTVVVPGDVIFINNGYSLADYLVLEVAGSVLTVAGQPLVADAYPVVGVVFTAISCEIQFNPLTGGEPAVMKMSNQVSFLFRRNQVRTTTATFHSEIAPADVEVALVVPGWGEFPWGELPWGGAPPPVRRVQPLPMGVDNCAQLSVGFRTRHALAKFEFLGIDTRAQPDTDAHP